MTTDQTAYVEVLARLLCAADGHVYGDDHPTWQQLSAEPGGRVQDDYRKAARWLAARLTVSSVGQAPATSQTALIALGAEAIRAAACPGSDCPHTEEECAEQRIQPAAWERGVLSEVYGRPEWFADAVLAVLPAPVDRAAVARIRGLHQQYRFAGDDTTDYCAHCNQISGGWIPWPCPTLRALDGDEAAAGRVADDTQPTEALVHACPPDGSGLTPCCGRTPFELPRTDRMTATGTVTCPGPAVGGAQQQETERGGCTCGSAGDAFRPAGHYRDCPEADGGPQ